MKSKKVEQGCLADEWLLLLLLLLLLPLQLLLLLLLRLLNTSSELNRTVHASAVSPKSVFVRMTMPT